MKELLCPSCGVLLGEYELKDMLVCPNCAEIFDKEEVRGYWNGD